MVDGVAVEHCGAFLELQKYCCLSSLRQFLAKRSLQEPIWNQMELCMEELGDGFSFVFVVCGVFGCCLTHVLGT